MAETTAVRRAEEPIKPIKEISLFDQIEDTFRTLSRRAYEIFESDGRALGRDLEHWLRAERELLHPVLVNVTELDDAFEVKAEVPGFSEKELEINVEPRRLTITGKREIKKEEKKGRTLYAESCADQILRSVDLPVEVETEKVTATLKNGVLEFTLPKVAKAKTIHIHPKAA
jgi:HSP20 family protein